MQKSLWGFIKSSPKGLYARRPSGSCLPDWQAQGPRITEQTKASVMGFHAAVPGAQLDPEVSGHSSSGFVHAFFLFANFCSLSLSSESPFFPSFPPFNSFPCGASSQASPASEQKPTGQESPAPAPASSATSTSQGKQLPASTAEGSPWGSGSSVPALLPHPTPASRTSTPGPPKASQTIEKLPYVPHSPFHLFSYDFEDSPLSTKEKEAEAQKESR